MIYYFLSPSLLFPIPIWAKKFNGFYYNKSGHLVKHVLYVTYQEAALAKIGDLEVSIKRLREVL
jgi:hypothetical protein